MITHQALALAGTAALLLAPSTAAAHGIETDLRRFAGLSSRLDFGEQGPGGIPAAAPPSEAFQLHSSFSTGMPAAAAVVRLLPPHGGEPIDLGRTDAEGQIRFALPPQAGTDWEIQVDAGPGHRDYLELAPTEESAAPLSQSRSPHRRPVQDIVRDLALLLRDASGGGGAGLVVLGMVGSLDGLLWSRPRG